METMRLLLLLPTIWTIVTGSAWAQSPPSPPLPTFATLELTVPANYPHFIENMQNIFSESYDKVKNLFRDAEGKIRVKLEYKVNDGSIGDMTKVPLRVRNLREHINGIYGQKTKKNFNQLQHEFFLLALQMVAEATRFKHISDKIPTKEEAKTLKADEKEMAPENGWDTLSEAIYMETEPSRDTTAKYKLKQSVSLKLDSENKLTISSEKEIKDVMGLLKKREQRSSENNDHGGSGGVPVTASS